MEPDHHATRPDMSREAWAPTRCDCGRPIHYTAAGRWVHDDEEA